MHRIVRLALAGALGYAALPASVLAQPAAARPLDLAALLGAGRLHAVGRTATALADGARRGVRLDSLGGYGVAWVDDLTLGDGVIELDLRGADAPGASFVGVAFHGVSDSTYEAVYLRPFNFRHADSASRAHAVQYVSHPAHPWRVLRERHPGRYEAALPSPTDPNGWVRLRLEIAHPVVRVFVGDAAGPSLTVRQLGGQRGGRLGLWVGNPSAGDFANLRVTAR